jgi:hypothetical protein
MALQRLERGEGPDVTDHRPHADCAVAYHVGDEAERTWHEIIPANTPAGPTLRSDNIGVVAAARELTEQVFFGLRDGNIRRLLTPPQPAA